MILCEDLSKILLVSKFETNWPNIKLIITFCTIWHYQGLKGSYMLISELKWLCYQKSLSVSL